MLTSNEISDEKVHMKSSVIFFEYNIFSPFFLSLFFNNKFQSHVIHYD